MFCKKYNDNKWKDNITNKKLELRMEDEIKCLEALKKYDIAPIFYKKEKNNIYMSDCGISFRSLKKNIVIKNINEQINNIVECLKKEKIMHNDMHLDGKNLCVDKNGKIYIIDFDMCTINYSGDSSNYDELKQKIINIIKNNHYVLLQ